jgi:hypothetical protein
MAVPRPRLQQRAGGASRVLRGPAGPMESNWVAATVAYVQQHNGGDFTGPLGARLGRLGLVCPR